MNSRSGHCLHSATLTGRALRKFHGELIALCLLVAGLGSVLGVADEPGAVSAAPFLKFRELNLGYHGPSESPALTNEIRIGWFGPTNVNDRVTGDLWWAIDWAVQQVNRAGGCQGLPLRIVSCWAADPWGSGVSKLTRMIYQEQPVALLGSIDSASTHLAEQVVAKANLPLVSPAITDQSVTLAGVPWMFSCAPSDVAVARVLVPEILGALRSTAVESNPKLLMLACTDHESRMTARELQKEFSRRARLPDWRLDVPAQELQPNQHMAALRSKGVAVVLIVAGPEDAACWVRCVREVIPRSEIFGTQGMGRRRFVELAGSAGEGVKFPLLSAPAGPGAADSHFKRAFEAARGHEPDYTAVLGCDATQLLMAAIACAGADRVRIRDVLQARAPWAGMGGPIVFDGTGQNTRTNLLMATLRGGVAAPKRNSTTEGACPRIAQ